jgi:hypothetical protein
MRFDWMEPPSWLPTSVAQQSRFSAALWRIENAVPIATNKTEDNSDAPVMPGKNPEQHDNCANIS